MRRRGNDLGVGWRFNRIEGISNRNISILLWVLLFVLTTARSSFPNISSNEPALPHAEVTLG